MTVLEKPKGVLSEDAQNGEKGLVGLLSEYAGKPVHLLHRLDRNVGGVMVFANNKKSAAVLSKDIAEGKLFKEYPNVPAEFWCRSKSESRRLPALLWTCISHQIHCRFLHRWQSR